MNEMCRCWWIGSLSTVALATRMTLCAMRRQPTLAMLTPIKCFSIARHEFRFTVLGCLALPAIAVVAISTMTISVLLTRGRILGCTLSGLLILVLAVG